MLFLTRGPMPHEALWTAWLAGARGHIQAECAAAAVCNAQDPGELKVLLQFFALYLQVHIQNGHALPISSCNPGQLLLQRSCRAACMVPLLTAQNLLGCMGACGSTWPAICWDSTKKAWLPRPLTIVPARYAVQTLQLWPFRGHALQMQLPQHMRGSTCSASMSTQPLTLRAIGMAASSMAGEEACTAWQHLDELRLGSTLWH